MQSKTLAYNTNAFIYNASQSVDGGYFISGFTNGATTGADPWVAKLDGNLNPLWSYGLGTPEGAFFKVAPTADGGCVTAGRVAVKNDIHNGDIIRAYNHAIVFKLDNTGTVVWGRQFYSTQEVEQIFEILVTKDGSVILSGVKDNGPNAAPGSDYFIMKLDGNTGQSIWQKQSPVYLGEITEMADGNLLFRQSNFLYFVNSNYGAATAATSFTLPAPYNNNYSLQYGGSFADKQDLYYDFVDRQDVLLLKMNNYDTVVWVTKMPGNNQYGIVDDPFSALIQQDGTQGHIYTGIGLSSQGLATHDSTQFEENSFVYRTDLNGQSPCVDPLNIAVAFDSFPLPELDNFTWYQTGNLSFNSARPVSVGGSSPVNGVNCKPNFCCSDTAVYVNDTLCLGSNYTLPDGTVISKAGLYSSILKRSTGCDSIVFATVTVLAKAHPNLGDDTCFIANAPITLNGSTPLAARYLWQNGSTDSTYNATVPGTYWVQASNLCGTFADTVTIYPQCSLPVYVPSVFTPNGDGRNDIFRIADIKHQKLLDFSIYSRWGALVFRTANVSEGWDGTINGQKVPPGVFVYLIHYTDLTGEYKYLKGTVVLVR